jgi:hypothetical protein
MLQDEFTIFIASDGGVFNHEGTFGVVLSERNAQLAQNNGKFKLWSFVNHQIYQNCMQYFLEF